MQYQAELSFFTKLLKNFNIPCYIASPPYYFTDAEPDLGFRRLSNSDIDYGRHFQTFIRQCNPNTIYRIRDPFLCQYYFFHVPDDSDCYVLVGPFTTEAISQNDILNIIDRCSLSRSLIGKFEKIYTIVPIIRQESDLFTLIHTLGELLWGGSEQFSIHEIDRSSLFTTDLMSTHTDSPTREETVSNMKVLEKRYESENRLLYAVSHGQTYKAEILMNAFSHAYLEKRTLNQLHDLKNYAIIANTLMRKATETGNVHPIHIDSLSSRFAKAIEDARSDNEIYRLGREMARKYCLLVNNYSMKKFSLLVQKVLVRIDSDLTADLSLKTQADLLNVNASYLSSLFKKEMGSSLTEYVNRKRVEYGVFLLNTTSLQIQTIAQYCGILDVNYFTRIFKKIVGQTPTEYRNHITSFP